jgi:two-component system sensor histidine kinase and response regulator WspE
MSDPNDDLSQYSMLDLFRLEARAQAQVLTDGLLAAEKGPVDKATVDGLMRAAHSIKGAAAVVGLSSMVQLAHAMEDAFIAAQQQRLSLDGGGIDALLAGVDVMAQLADVEEAGIPAWLQAQNRRIIDVMAGVRALLATGAAAGTPARARPPAPAGAASTDPSATGRTEAGPARLPAAAPDPSAPHAAGAQGSAPPATNNAPLAPATPSSAAPAVPAQAGHADQPAGTPPAAARESKSAAAPERAGAQAQSTHKPRKTGAPAAPWKASTPAPASAPAPDSEPAAAPSAAPDSEPAAAPGAAPDSASAAASGPAAAPTPSTAAASAWTSAASSQISGADASLLPPVPVPGPVPADVAQDGAPADANLPARAGRAHLDQLLGVASRSRIHAHQLEPMLHMVTRAKRQQHLLGGALDAAHEAALQSGDRILQARVTAARDAARPVAEFIQQHLAELELYERRVQTLSQQLDREVLALRMRPFRDAVHGFPRMVRDLARTLGKRAQLVIDGDTTLVDRAVLQKIESPLNHLLRNAIDHGIEAPSERQAQGKPDTGMLRLSARHHGGMLVVDLRDDGRGANLEHIRRKVIERALATESLAARMSDAELLEFLFLPAFTLKEGTTEISGRGVGLDLVQDSVRALNGSLRVNSQPGAGFHVEITLPLSQSVKRVLVVQIQGEAYGLQIARVERVLTLAREAIGHLENRPFFTLDEEPVGLVWAAQLLDLGQEQAGEGELPVIVLGGPGRRYGLVVQAIEGERNLAVQALEPVFGKLRHISSGALLDDGRPLLILDQADLLVSIGKLLEEGGLEPVRSVPAGAAASVRRILVVDDSLTVREMERKLLAARGYSVDVAVDGMDGWNMVRHGDYHLVVTDVDMPRLDGIELTRLIRQDPRLHALPIMIVSYKDRVEDRARGMEAGADYYLAKGSFHDDRLLDAVVDLIGEAHP